MNHFIPVTIAYGDGIGPEIMEAVLYLLKEASVPLRIEIVEIGEKLYSKNYRYGISESGWVQLKRTKALLKSPVALPQHGSCDNFHTALRKFFSLHTNVDRIASYPLLSINRYPSSQINIVIIYNSEEDMRAAIKYRNTNSIWETSNTVSYHGSEQIITFAFEYALKHGYKKVTCVTENFNSTNSIFLSIFNTVAKKYSSSIKAESHDVEHCYVILHENPELFGVIVTPSIYSDMLRSIITTVTGLSMMAATANIGANYAMFEPRHSISPDITSPLGLLNATIMMLKYLALNKHAENIEQAISKAIASGIHTADIYNENVSKQKVSTREFVQAIKEYLSPTVAKLSMVTPSVNSQNTDFNTPYDLNNKCNIIKKLVGVDIFCASNTISSHIHILNYILDKSAVLDYVHGMQLSKILVRGIEIWPECRVASELFSDYWCLRFHKKASSNTADTESSEDLQQNQAIDFDNIIKLLQDLSTLLAACNPEHIDHISQRIDNSDNDFVNTKSQSHKIIQLEIVKIQNLFLYNNKPGFDKKL